MLIVTTTRRRPPDLPAQLSPGGTSGMQEVCGTSNLVSPRVVLSAAKCPGARLSEKILPCYQWQVAALDPLADRRRRLSGLRQSTLLAGLQPGTSNAFPCRCGLETGLVATVTRIRAGIQESPGVHFDPPLTP